ncbi:MAG TPA: hypothetical protein VND91_02935 [Candidatus Saccharimonadia bacterium]|nr:hypothetical protein [Candidatus Saccharimonadia bacterium]
MSHKVCKPLAIALGTALLGSVSAANAAPAFALVDLGSGYMLSAGGEGKCGEGKCGMGMADANKDGTVTRAEHTAHAAAMFAAVDTNKDGNVTQAERDVYHAAHKGKEGKCGEGKCGGEKGKEGSCGGEKGKEGSCGGEKGKEGSCGGAA